MRGGLYDLEIACACAKEAMEGTGWQWVLLEGRKEGASVSMSLDNFVVMLKLVYKGRYEETAFCRGHRACWGVVFNTFKPLTRNNESHL